MPVYDTTGPVRARIELAAGAVRVRASDRADVRVDVHPASPTSSGDIAAAEQTRVEFADGTLRVTTPRRPRLLFFGSGPAVEIEVLLPEGSHLDVDCIAGEVSCDGRLGDVRVNSRYGDVRVDRATTLRAHTSAGDITVNAVDGRGEATTSYGNVRIASAAGDLRLDSACGDISVDHAHGSVDASTKYGQVRVGEAVRGELVLETAYGSVEAGIRRGTAAWLDVASAAGKVRNSLSESAGPDDAEETVRLRARTAYGDVVIRRP